MQPVALHVHGLHSFREAVDVDLEALGEHGLFGVFGPVGSGKSTLLDAMTLALYGQVDRLVGRSRRGIVNHQSRTCEVRLRFRVGEELWEAQRAYRADDDGVAARVHSRLARVLPRGLEVVADKEREVNAAVERLVGLTASDFMRAVVLPQGRFMQFLHLQGADRRRMLQRIFHLEAWGEGLRARVKARADLVDGRLQRTLGELDGLGPAGEQDLQDARAERDAAALGAASARAELAAAQVRWEAAQRSHAHTRDLATARSLLATHLERQEEMDVQRDRVKAARRARPALALVRAWREAREAADLASSLATTASARSAVAREHAAAAERSHEQARTARAARAPELEARRHALRGAVRLLADLAEASTRTQKLAQRRGQLRRRVEEDDRAVEDLERELEASVARRTELASAWTDTEVTPALRERVRAAEAARAGQDAARKRADATRAAAEDASARLAEAERARDRAEGSMAAARSRRAAVERDHARTVAQRDAIAPWIEASRAARTGGMVERVELARAEVERASAEEDRARARRDEAARAFEAQDAERPTRDLLAGVLARALVDGEPCAVCGSSEHPSPAAARGESELLEVLESRARARATLDAREDAAQAASRALADAEARRDAAEAALPALLRPDAAGVLRRIDVALEVSHRAEERAKRTLAALDRGLEDARALGVSAAARAEAAMEERARLLEEHAEAADRAARIWVELTEALGDLTLFDLPRLVKEIHDKDRVRGSLEPRLRKAEAELAGAQRAWEARRGAAATRRTELERVKAEHDGAEARHQELLARLQEACPSGDPGAALALVDAEIDGLDSALAERGRALEQARGDLLEATAAEASAMASARAAEGRVERTRRAAGRDPEGIDQARLEQEAWEGADLDELDGEVRAWSERRAALALGVETLEAAGVEPVDDDALWKAAQARDDAEIARQVRDDALTRASERLTGLVERAARVAALTAEHGDLSVQAARLGTLGRLLRGDRFVEYVANDHLTDLVREASIHLASLTRGRYALALDEDGGFLVADLDAGGAVRPASSLSGGETFLTSLALALALSTQVQRHSRNALEFFFLDEGFGSLDPEALDRVMTAIEGLSGDKRVIGLISHVGAVRERVPRYLELSCPRDGGGTRVAVREA